MDQGNFFIEQTLYYKRKQIVAGINNFTRADQLSSPHQRMSATDMQYFLSVTKMVQFIILSYQSFDFSFVLNNCLSSANFHSN